MTNQEIAEKWAPEIRFDSDEKCFPSSVYYYLERVSLKWERSAWGDKTIFKPGEMNEDNIKETLIDVCEKKEGRYEICSGDTRQGGKNKVTEFYLKNKNDTLRKGQDPETEEIPCYANYIVRNSEKIEIQYWFFYPSNRRLGTETHDSDWEHVTVKLNTDGSEIEKMYFAHHGNGEWVKQEHLEFNSDGHPIVYCSKGGHAAYPKANMHNTTNPADGNGKKWSTYKKVKILGTKNEPTEGNEWLKYNGAWGRWFIGLQSTGIPGPAYQKRWIKK